ncbi:glycerophosphodiester phosphodiesterase [Streptomyces microflavus]|uniref:glycerophosphodiester phosphodiesterase n=1 Tax=Streptomyces microflavus TaxID=1919 RepID=UPI002E32233A|nr:glycerophosphodiester phosphodiesterase [Streptomyces microflavus]
MALPDGAQTITITDSRTHPDGGPMRGRIVLRPAPRLVTNPDLGHIAQGDAEASWVDGELTLTVLAADADGYDPTGYTHTVMEYPEGAPGRLYPVLLTTDLGDTVDLATLAPTTPYGGDYVLVPGPEGPAGPPGPDGTADAEDYTDDAVAAAEATAATLYLPNALVTWASYMADASPASPKYFAHRGGGQVRPEHTLTGYRAAAAQGYALEVSCVADGTRGVWCLHDPTLDRTTNRTGLLSSYTTEEVSQQVRTNARPLLGRGWEEQPLVLLRQVLDEFLGHVPILLEAKTNDTVVPVQELLDRHYPHAYRSVVWKAHVGTLSLPWAKDRDNPFPTWTYLDPNTPDEALAAKDLRTDAWGVSTTFTDARIEEIVDRGKPVYAWPVYRRSQRDRLTALGIVGLMSSDPSYVSRNTPMRTADRWALGVKESGGLPPVDYENAYALKFEEGADEGWVSLPVLPNQSYGLGTYSPLSGSYSIGFDMKYPILPASGTHGGYYFGKESDDVYRFTNPNASGGYHVVMRASGAMELYRHTAGITSGTRISDIINTAAPVANTPMSFEIDVTPTTVELRRTDGTGWTTGPIADTEHRGGYHGLSNGSITDLTTRPYWRKLTTAAL